MHTVWTRFGNLLRAFGRARGGNVAIMFGFAVIPLVAAVGAAVDYTNANATKTAMQAALDSTALMLSRDASTLSQADLDAKALSYFTALFNNKTSTTNITIKANYTATGGSTVTVTGAGKMPTQFMEVVGFDNINIGTASTVKWGSQRLRVALVLDNTGSMKDDGKIGALKTATTNLLAQLKAAASVDGDVYVSIVPFVKDVSFDTSGGIAAWSDQIYFGTVAQDPGLTDNSSWDANNGSCSINNKSPRSTCITSGKCSISGNNSQNSCQSAGNCSISGNNSQSSCQNDGVCSISGNNNQNSCQSAGVCSKSGYNTQSACLAAGTCSISGNNTQSSCQSAGVCSKASHKTQSGCLNSHGTWTTGVWTSTPGTWTTGVWTAGVWTAGVWTLGVWTPANHSTWNGCVTDRGLNSGPSSDYDRLVTAPTSTINASLFPAEQYSACPASIMGLNYNWTDMTTLVSNMVANGSTNQPIGLVWGWQTLVGGGPFTSPAMDPNYEYKQVIILLSDGLNTQDRWYGDGSHTSTSVDYRMYDTSGNGTCANIKAAGITIYSIQVNTGGDPTSTLLQNCATDSSKFFLLTTADQIVTTFESIGTNLTKLRVAQ